MMLSRFVGSSGRSNRIDTLLEIPNLSSDRSLAEKIADSCVLEVLRIGNKVIIQGEEGQDVYFVLSGQVEITVLGKTRRVTCDAPILVGEMAVMKPDHPRSATVTAMSDTVVLAVIKGKKFRKLLEEFPQFKKTVSDDIDERIRSWMKPNTEQPATSPISLFKPGGVGLIGAIVFFALFLNIFTTNLIIAGSASAAVSVVCFYLAQLSLAAVLWGLFIASAMMIASSVIPKLSMHIAMNLGWIQLDGGYGGQPSVWTVIMMIIVTLILLFAALKISASNAH
jgi:CRP-like cAMP-binding protein